ncbi:MAG: helicase [Verrucomicrobiaceae bacterium]|nr:MAG: helicase [Verrucomicrobiaceae bacterium]
MAATKGERVQNESAAEYAAFLDRKAQLGGEHGFEPISLPPWLFDFQASLVEWALRKGRAAIFADCGLGKTAMELVWADNVVQRTNGKVLLLTPLAVTHQIAADAEKFGIAAKVSRDGVSHPGITITNYEKLHLFNAADFVGVACDESSILKSYSGSTRGAITAFARKLPYRLLATATAAPNDFTELGTSSEALGYLGHMDMLNRFFKNDLNNSASGRFAGEVIKWRLKGHAELPFWRWVCSWARAVRRPSDIGFDDSRFILPPINEVEHVVESNTCADGMLFALPAVGLDEQREERRRTVRERCERVASLVNGTGQPALVWCHLNDESELLSDLIPDAVEVSGKDSDDKKEGKLLDFANSRARVLITKPKIGAWGLNYQHCNHITFFPSHSFEQYYQGVRRCWRFGQQRQVTVDIVTTEGERGVLRNLQRKAAQADTMFSNLVAQMNAAQAIERASQFTKTQEIPSWLSTTN